MMLKTLGRLMKTEWALKFGIRAGHLLTSINEFKNRNAIKIHKSIYLEKERRVLDAITMRKEPDRVPVITGGLNFFPAKYAGITCADYMYDFKKMKMAFMKMHDDFNFDLTFPSFMLSFGRVMTAADVNLIKIPGRDISVNSCYQYNEMERLKPEEYGEFLERGMDFLMDTIAPRVSGIFKKNRLRRIAHLGRTTLEILKYLKGGTEIMGELKAKGQYCLMEGTGFPPFDIVSFVFRKLAGLTRDMMKKATRSQLIELLNRMETWLTPMISALPRMNRTQGIWFTSERAFSLSPRQFAQYYWPTLKKMIISMVEVGDIPFLVWESDVTHLIHFLLELPKKISRRCIFMCDTSDIFEVNRILDGHMSIVGNVPLSTMVVGTPKDVEKYCDKMFAKLMPGGGFINCSALGIPDEAKPENIHALINYTHKNGVYK
jgi:hypothetical protein